MWRYLFNSDKLKYVKKDKTNAGCFLCALRDENPEVVNLEIARGHGFIVSVNLYPFNPGHILIFPSRHVEKLRDLTDQEALAMHRILSSSLEILNEEFAPCGFNIGFNLGQNSGASTPHIHMHVVPRFGNEVGYLDVLAGTRAVVSDPVETRDRLRRKFENI
jgi:ATP adenylyltransferase